MASMMELPAETRERNLLYRQRLLETAENRYQLIVHTPCSPSFIRGVEKELRLLLSSLEVLNDAIFSHELVHQQELCGNQIIERTSDQASGCVNRIRNRIRHLEKWSRKATANQRRSARVDHVLEIVLKLPQVHYRFDKQFDGSYLSLLEKSVPELKMIGICENDRQLLTRKLVSTLPEPVRSEFEHLLAFRSKHSETKDKSTKTEDDIGLTLVDFIKELHEERSTASAMEYTHAQIIEMQYESWKNIAEQDDISEDDRKRKHNAIECIEQFHNMFKDHRDPSDFNCLFCTKKHPEHNCTAAFDMPLAPKMDTLRRNSRCLRCTQPGHLTLLCRSEQFCNRCGKRHSTVVCAKDAPAKEETTTTITPAVITTEAATEGSSRSPMVPASRPRITPAQSPLVPISPMLFVRVPRWLISDEDRSGFWSTARARVEANGNAKSVRIIFDKNCPYSFISPSLIGNLKLDRVEHTLRPAVIVYPDEPYSKAQNRLLQRVRVRILPHENSPQSWWLTMHSLSLLNNRVKRRSLPWNICNRLDEMHVQLSDGVWRQPNEGEMRVDILLGADHMRKLGYHDDNFVQLELRRDLSAGSTKIGWVLCGSGTNEDEPPSPFSLPIPMEPLHNIIYV